MLLHAKDAMAIKPVRADTDVMNLCLRFCKKINCPCIKSGTQNWRRYINISFLEMTYVMLL